MEHMGDGAVPEYRILVVIRATRRVVPRAFHATRSVAPPTIHARHVTIHARHTVSGHCSGCGTAWRRTTMHTTVAALTAGTAVVFGLVAGLAARLVAVTRAVAILAGTNHGDLPKERSLRART